jgi:hypothetical protein
LGTNIVNLRSDGEGDTIITLTAKTVWFMAAEGGSVTLQEGDL